jgi:hypothetical protein
MWSSISSLNTFFAEITFSEIVMTALYNYNIVCAGVYKNIVWQRARQDAVIASKNQKEKENERITLDVYSIITTSVPDLES